MRHDNLTLLRVRIIGLAFFLRGNFGSLTPPPACTTPNNNRKQVFLRQSIGLLQARTAAGARIPGVYCKVYAKLRGATTAQTVFYKDGYTDVLGEFWYADTNHAAAGLAKVESFAVLACHPEYGAVVNVLQPPRAS